MENAIIEYEFDYPGRKDIRERDKRVLEHSYPDHKSRYEGALRYLSGDFVQFLWRISPPTPEAGEEGWRFIHPVKTVEEHYSEHPRYPLYAPIKLYPFVKTIIQGQLGGFGIS